MSKQQKAAAKASGGMLLAIDPGDEHVGVAWFDKQGKPGSEAWGCVYVEEMSPVVFREYIGPALNSGIFRYLVVESFSLYGDKAMEQTGSEMLTSQMIGMIKYARFLAERTGVLISIIMQQPSIKKPVFAILARKKYEFTADRLNVPGQHVRDAEVHGVKFIRDTMGWKMLKASELWTEPLPHYILDS